MGLPLGADAGMRDFTWRDGERVVRFGRGAIAEAPLLLDEPYTLLSTPRARASAPAIEGGAAGVIDIAPGRVDELAGALLGRVAAGLVVGFGGGRVIDTAKAVAAATPGSRAAAIPTTLSAAEMTAVHRPAAGAPSGTRGVRPVLVVNDPDVSASQPEPELAASAGNALAHALEGPLTTLASPVPAQAGAFAAGLIAGAFGKREPLREDLALASLLSGYAIDSCGYGLHHVLSQTLVRFAGAGHGQANVCLLPHTLPALRRRAPERLASLADGLGRDLVELAAELAARARASRLRDIGVAQGALAECAAHAAARGELQMIPPAPGEQELLEIYEAAW